MKKIPLLIGLLCATVNAQHYIDMTTEMSNIKGHFVIDGNQIQNKLKTKEQIIITGKDMVIHDRSSFIFNNIIVQLTGNVIVKGELKPMLIDSYILCKYSDMLKSKYIIEVVYTDEVLFSNTKVFKSIKRNAEVWIYDMTGKRIAKGIKHEIANTKLKVSRYDIKVVGERFIDKVLIY